MTAFKKNTVVFGTKDGHLFKKMTVFWIVKGKMCGEDLWFTFLY